MIFAGINVWAVIVAAIASFAAGAAYYGALGGQWMRAAGMDEDEVKASGPPVGPMITSFVTELIMAVALAGLVGHLGIVSVRVSLISALSVWVGFVVGPTAVNYAFQSRPLALTAIDAGHWLMVLLIQGLIIGLFGV